MAFNWAKTGDLLKFFDSKWAWREVTVFGFGGRYLGTALFHVALATVALGVVVAAARDIPRSWKVLTGLSLLPSLVLGIVGLARYANECFPPFAAGGQLLERRGHRTVTAVFAALVVGQVMFAIWIVALRHLP